MPPDSPRKLPNIELAPRSLPNGPVWRRHWEQLQPRYEAEVDNEPSDATNVSEFMTDHPMEV